MLGKERLEEQRQLLAGAVCHLTNLLTRIGIRIEDLPKVLSIHLDDPSSWGQKPIEQILAENHVPQEKWVLLTETTPRAQGQQKRIATQEFARIEQDGKVMRYSLTALVNLQNLDFIKGLVLTGDSLKSLINRFKI